jgi:hypothetical protein
MEQLLKILQEMQNDIRGIKRDVRELSDKVDSQKMSSDTFSENENQSKVQKINERGEVYFSNGKNTSGTESGVNINPTVKTDDFGNKNLQSLTEKSSDDNLLNDKQPVNEIATEGVGAIAKEEQVITPKKREKNWLEKFFTWLAQDWPMKVGGAFIIAAIGWFVTWAAMVGWLSETARIVLGYLFAVVAIVFGARRVEKNTTQGNLFLIIGIGAMLISTLGGVYYNLVSHIVGLFVMLVTVGLVTLISLKQDRESLTAAMIFFGAIIPIFFFQGLKTDSVFIYLFILSLGSLWVVFLKKWRSLMVFSLLMIGSYSFVNIAGNIHTHDMENFKNILISFLFGGLFYSANVALIVITKQVKKYDVFTALMVGVLMLVWILSFASKDLEPFLLLLVALIFGSGGYFVFAETKIKAPAIIYGGVAMTLIAITTAILLDGASLITAYFVELCFVVATSLALIRRKVTGEVQAFSMIAYSIVAIFSLNSVSDLFYYLNYAHQGDDMMKDLITIFTAFVTAFVIAGSVVIFTNLEEKNNMTFFRFFAYAGEIFGLLFVWFVTHLFFSSYDVATFISLVIYTIIGLSFYVMGAKINYQPYRIVGGMLFALVIGRVLLVEFWEMEMVVRMITALVLGGLLISTAFIKSNNK